MTPPYLGHCLCGQIKFRLNSEPLTLYACHCTDCQRRSGGAFLLSMWVHRESLEVLEGTPTLVSSIANDGRERKNKVCPACQIRLWAEPVDRPKLAILRPGMLERSRNFSPVAHQFVRSAVPWFVFPEGVARFEAAADPAELVRLWREARAPAAQVLADYFRAKDGNRPHLLERVFCADAQLEVKNKTAAIAFPAVTLGREAIADVLVRNFGRDNENVYSFYLCQPPAGAVETFSCSWLVGMTEKSTGSVRVGCGEYQWTFDRQQASRAEALVISIDAMQVLPHKEVGLVMAWLGSLPYPWCKMSSAASSIPAIDGLEPVVEFLRKDSV